MYETMYTNAYSAMDLIQIVGTIVTCWFCYQCGKKTGIAMVLSNLNIDELKATPVVKNDSDKNKPES